MRAIVAVVVSLVCILALVLWLARSEPTVVVPIAAANDAAPESARPDSRGESLTPAPPTDAAERVPSVPQPAATTTAVALGPRCRVFGRVLDETGAPLADLPVHLFPVGGRWSDTATIEKAGPAGYEREKLRTTTAADGRFSFEAPLPTADWITLQVEPDPYRSLFEREFGRAGGRDKPPIVEGDNDMGDIQLAACGAVSGRILSAAGLPIPRANAAVPGINAEGRLSNSTPDADGRFLVGHVPAGMRKLIASAEGWIQQRDIPVEVRANATTPMADIVLAPHRPSRARSSTSWASRSVASRCGARKQPARASRRARRTMARSRSTWRRKNRSLSKSAPRRASSTGAERTRRSRPGRTTCASS